VVADQSNRRAHTPTRFVPWYEAKGGGRFRADRELVGRHYPSLSFKIDGKTKRAILEGELRFESHCGASSAIAVRIDFPDDYPKSEPIAYDSSSRFIHDAAGHFYEDGRSCLWLGCESEWDRTDPDALLVFIDQVTVFFHRQLVFEAGDRKKWPGPARGHGSEGYLEFLRDELNVPDEIFRRLLPAFRNYREFFKYDLCPCGSGKRFRWCHDGQVKEILGRAGRRHLQERLAVSSTMTKM
jgi:hypothetical protein